MAPLSKWQEIQRRQGIANAERWLNTLESEPHPTQLVLQEYGNLLRAIEYTLASPESFDQAYRLIDTLFSYANSYADWDRWLIYLQKALEISETLAKKLEEASLLEKMAAIYRNQGAFQEAEACSRQALAIVEQLAHVPQQAISLSNLALAIEDSGQDGLIMCQAALQLATESGDKEACTRASLSLSSIYMRRHEWQAGLQSAQTAYDLACQLQNPILDTRSLFNVVTCLGRLGKWDEARSMFTKLENDLIQRGDLHTLTKLRINLGLTAYSLNNWQEAEQQWQEALNLQSVLQEPVHQAYLYNNLGMVYTRIGELETAKELLQQAAALQEQLNDIYQWANALDNLAEVYDAEGDTAVARHIRQQAYTRLQTLYPTAQTPQIQKLLVSLEKNLQLE